MYFPHPLGEIHAVVLGGGNAHIGPRGQGIVLLPDFGTGRNFAQARNILIFSFTEFLIEPDRIFSNRQLLL